MNYVVVVDIIVFTAFYDDRKDIFLWFVADISFNLIISVVTKQTDLKKLLLFVNKIFNVDTISGNLENVIFLEITKFKEYVFEQNTILKLYTIK